MAVGPAGRVHGRLRAATRAPHHRLDSHRLMVALMRGDVGLPSYLSLLRRYAELYSGLECAIERGQAALPRGFDWSTRRKLPWLEADLRHFGARADMDQSCAADVVRTPGEAIGLLYPLEGATLGGQVIGKRLERSLGIGPTAGGRFFTGYGADTRSRWDATCVAIEAIGDDEREIETATNRALWVFERFADALERAATG